MDEWNPQIKSNPFMIYQTTAQEIEDYMKALNLPEKKEKYDSVDRPKHYMLFDEDAIAKLFSESRGIEVRNVLEKLAQKLQNSQGPTGVYYLFESDYVQMMQYLMRFMDKNGVEDLKKARWYLDKMIEAY